MQSNTFVGNAASKPIIKNGVAKVTLIANEYAGRDEKQEAKYRKVILQFTAFKHHAEALEKNVQTGDQVIIKYRVENNNYEREGNMVYGFSFIVEDFTFGAHGKEKREQNPQA